MDVKKIVLLVGALIIAAVTAVMAKNMFSGAAAPQAQAGPVVPAGPEVLVATRTLPVGTIIDAEAFRYQPWPEGLVQQAYYVRGQGGVDPSTLIGTVVRNEITAGQPVTQGAIVRPGERGFLAAALGPGMRAVTVAVSATSGRRRLRLPGRPRRPGPHPGSRRRRRRIAPARLRDDHPQHPRPRRRPAHRRPQRRRQAGRPGRRHGDVRGHPQDRREDRGRADHRPAVAVAALARRQQCRAGARDRVRRGYGAGKCRSAGRAADAARHRQPADRHQPDLHGRIRRLPLPAQQRTWKAALRAEQCAGRQRGPHRK